MKIYCLLLVLLTQPLWAQMTSTPDLSLIQAQARVWDIGLKLNAAIYHLNTLKLSWQMNELTTALTEAQQTNDTVAAGQIQKKLTKITHLQDLEKQKFDLNNQLISAEQQGDQAQINSILFQLKSLQ